ncbi:peptidase M22 [Neobittarella massiliensis]|uniref:N(6)-L-threonylcarbamoyladenine synthase n=2 Tax=Oscillospiraceae TaxID=216572 RepID=A0A8J6ILB1_9FIRM|nr:peptidase M22 [Neobittarella massiliensis]MBC3515744.1 peptidase M22 [Neobittarella massiliensis]SCJ47533.1 t(6)A37 threonylcarbamoyladenosine biosynthesis protein [uncultured Anaerotruncus sp.]
MRYFLGIDTSNYTTSLALCDEGGQVCKNVRLPLPVKDGQLGLRQSDACFLHAKNFSLLQQELMADLSAGEISAIGVSARPRDIEGSYMPCFLVGEGLANVFGKLLCRPVYRVAHQQGHIMAALYGAGAMPLLEAPFLAFHLSGGTTEAVLVTPDDTRILKTSQVAGSLDLKAGQAVDRVGGMLGLPFPAGKQLDALACQSRARFHIKPVLKGFDCCLSGVQNQCQKMVDQGAPAEDVARYCIEYICAALDGMTARLLQHYGDLPVVYAGGVMSNSLIAAAMGEKYGGYFAPADFSADNAAGVALLARRAHAGRRDTEGENVYA